VGSEAAIATGEDFPDALSIAAIAAKRGMPILLSEKNSLPAEVKTFIAQNNITTTYIVGGSDVVSDNVMNQLPGHERIFGDNRYDTNAAIINRFMGDLDFSTTYLATGEDFPDALSGSALAAKTASPVVLTYKSPDLSTSKVIDISSSSIAQLKIFGGDDVVPDSTVSFLAPVVNTIGNTVGNLENRGHAARQGSWIFYSFYYARQGSTGLYKSRVDNTGIQKLCDIQADHINVVGQWVYFNDNSFPVSMYKIRTDGTGGPVLLQSNAFLTNVIGDWIYYFGDGFCKMKTDGTEKTKISNLVGTGTVYGDWLYSAPESRIYKVKLDGTGFMKITDDNAWYMNVEGDWIYYTDYSGTDYYRALYKIRTDGTEKTLVNSEMSYCLNVQDGWIYYMNCNDGRKLYKIRPDGTGRTKITNEDTEEANILGDWIYYERVDSLNEIYEYYRVKMDGTGRERIQ
jgi:Putative cell wall-binding domain